MVNVLETQSHSTICCRKGKHGSRYHIAYDCCQNSKITKSDAPLFHALVDRATGIIDINSKIVCRSFEAHLSPNF